MSRSHSRILPFNADPQRVYWLSADANSDNTPPDVSPRQMYAQNEPVDASPPRLATRPEWLSVHDLDEDEDWAFRRGED